MTVRQAQVGARKTINLTHRGLAALERLVESEGYNETDTINRALTLHAALIDFTDTDGAITFLNGEGEEVTVILL